MSPKVPFPTSPPSPALGFCRSLFSRALATFASVRKSSSSLKFSSLALSCNCYFPVESQRRLSSPLTPEMRHLNGDPCEGKTYKAREETTRTRRLNGDQIALISYHSSRSFGGSLIRYQFETDIEKLAETRDGRPCL